MKKYLAVTIVILAAVGLVYFFYFGNGLPGAQSITVKGSLMQINLDEKEILIEIEDTIVNVEVGESTKLVDRQGNKVTLEFFEVGAKVQVMGAQGPKEQIIAREIILLETLSLPEDIKNSAAFKAWLADWKILWPELNEEEFEKQKVSPLNALALTQDATDFIPRYVRANTLSPGGQMYANHLYYWEEAEAGVVIFNRLGDEKMERIAFCGRKRLIAQKS